MGYWRGKTLPDEVKERISKTLTGRKEPEETRLKKSQAHKGVKRSPEACKKISEGKIGKPKPPGFSETMSKIRRGVPCSEITKIKLKTTMKGENNPWWKGGTSFEPYCPKFNKDFKERVREFFGRKCAACGIDEATLKRKLDVHHVNFNKMTCCDNTIPLFVPLCHSCHGKTQKDRQYWEDWFTQLINEQYGGKCYLPKEELQLPETSQTGDKPPA